MNGAESLVRTLVGQRRRVSASPTPAPRRCTSSPRSTSVQGMRCVLGLFEGVVTGAADGYYRMAGKPGGDAAAPGPGPGQRPGQPAQRQEGALGHRQHRRRARELSPGARRAADLRHRQASRGRCRTGCSTSAIVAATSPRDGAVAVQAARTPPGRIATLILPADTAWGPEAVRRRAAPAAQRASRCRPRRSRAAAARAAPAASRRCCCWAARRCASTALQLAGRIAAKTGCTLLANSTTRACERGAGRVRDRSACPMWSTARWRCWQDLRHMVLVGAKPPVAFFAYPGKPSLLAPPAARFSTLADGASRTSWRRCRRWPMNWARRAGARSAMAARQPPGAAHRRRHARGHGARCSPR